jgi:hypothetical protein
LLKNIYWGYGSILLNASSHLEKDEDLKDSITSSRIAYARKTKMAWDPTLWVRSLVKLDTPEKCKWY